METIKESIEVNVPVSTAYNQWTQFEEFPKFMEGVESVEQIDDTHLRWVAEVGGERRSGRRRSSIRFPIRRSPGARSTQDGPNGVVTFEPLGADTDDGHRRDVATSRKASRSSSARRSGSTRAASSRISSGSRR